MIVIVCIDDGGGMMFGGRRQSRDRELRRRVLNMAAGSNLLMNEYSFGQFKTEPDVPETMTPAVPAAAVSDAPAAPAANIIVSEDFLKEAGDGDICFVEDRALQPWEDRIEKVIVYKWNRAYPGDFTLDLDLRGWILTQCMDFQGSSHERITEEIFVPGSAAEPEGGRVWGVGKGDLETGALNAGTLNAGDMDPGAESEWEAEQKDEPEWKTEVQL